jgi:hypothetical protein
MKSQIVAISSCGSRLPGLSENLAPSILEPQILVCRSAQRIAGHLYAFPFACIVFRARSSIGLLVDVRAATSR